MSIWFSNWLPLVGQSMTAVLHFPVELRSSMMDLVSAALRVTQEQIFTWQISLLCLSFVVFPFRPSTQQFSSVSFSLSKSHCIHVFIAKLKCLKLKRNPLLSICPFITVRANVLSNNCRGQIIIVIKTESFAPAVKISPPHIFAWTSGLFCAPLIVTLLWLE